MSDTLDRAVDRRRVLAAVGAAGVGSLAGCITDESTDPDGTGADLVSEGLDEVGVSTPVETTIVAVAESQQVRVAQLVQAAYEETDLFDVSVAELEFGTYLDRLMGAADSEDDTIFCLSWGGGWDPNDYTRPLFHSDQHAPAGFNVNHFDDDEVDSLIESGISERDSPARQSTYETLQGRLLETLPVSVVRFGEEYHVWDTEAVTEWQTYPLPGLAFWPIHAPTDSGVSLAGDGTELIADLPSGIRSFDPIVMEDTTSIRATSLIYEPLVTLDGEGTARPSLATDWEFVDETTVRLTLREDVVFHNGETLTADHVIGTLDRYEGSIKSTLVTDWYDGGRAVEDSVVELDLSQSYAPLEATLLQIPIVPMAVIEGDHDLADRPIGTGPYRLDEHQPDTLFRLERFDDHWLAGTEAVPPAETVTFRIVVDPAARQAALEAGDIHLSTAVPAESLSSFEDNDSFGTDRTDTGGFDLLIWPLYTEPFSNQTVRQGCDRLIPREDILDTVYHGIGQPGYTPIPPLLEPYSSTDLQESLAEEHGILD